MLRRLSVLFSACVLAGCGGQYRLTLPDQIAPAGGEAAVAVRLQQREFASIMRSVEDAPIRLRIADGVERGAFSDELGFAGTTVPVPSTEGKYTLLVSVQTAEGDEISAWAPAYVWKADAAVIAVDLDCLPKADQADACAAAAKALDTLAATAHILYLTRHDIYDKAAARARVQRGGYPDGPVIVWLRRYRHFARMGRLRLPRIFSEARLVSRADYLSKLLPGLTMGICDSPRSAQAFARAGISVVVVGSADVASTPVKRSATWAELPRVISSP